MKNNEITAFIKERIDSFSVQPIENVKGVVTSSGDGVVRISGLERTKYGELLEFDNGDIGMALDLAQEAIGAVLFDNSVQVNVGERVRRLDKVAGTPVGFELLGRVVDAIGRPLDNLPLVAKQYYPSERNAPSIIERRPIDTPLMTGIMTIDSMIPIGRGQRELIIGDRQTGKTTIAIDSILNQKDTGVLCVYCAIGQKASTVNGVVQTLKSHQAMSYTTVVCATASDAPALQYLAPYSACSIAEFYAENGKDVLIVYDDLSKHAVAYRTMSLLLSRPSGREAYPGDIFYLHSRLLERSACYSKDLGGGTITALPIVETMANNISAYIPTNVISITDGQIYLEESLFHAGVRPAVNTGLSVSRVGRAAQSEAMKKVSGTLRISLSQYREMEVFNRFGNDLDESVRLLLKKGANLVELCKQDKSKPLSLFHQISLLSAYHNGIFDRIDTRKVKDFAQNMLVYLHENAAILENRVNTSFLLSDEDKTELLSIIKAYVKEANV